MTIPESILHNEILSIATDESDNEISPIHDGTRSNMAALDGNRRHSSRRSYTLQFDERDYRDSADCVSFKVEGMGSKEKPSYSYAALIGLAILHMPGQRARLSTIYHWISTNFMFYQLDNGGWQNSIRHNLTVNKCFIKDIRKTDPPGKGSFWAIHPDFKEYFATGAFDRPRVDEEGNRITSPLPRNKRRHSALPKKPSLAAILQTRQRRFSDSSAMRAVAMSQQNNQTPISNDYSTSPTTSSSSANNYNSDMSIAPSPCSEYGNAYLGSPRTSFTRNAPHFQQSYHVPVTVPALKTTPDESSLFFSVFATNKGSPMVSNLDIPHHLLPNTSVMTPELMFGDAIQDNLSLMDMDQLIDMSQQPQVQQPTFEVAFEMDKMPSNCNSFPTLGDLRSGVPSLMTSFDDLVMFQQQQQQQQPNSCSNVFKFADISSQENNQISESSSLMALRHDIFAGHQSDGRGEPGNQLCRLLTKTDEDYLRWNVVFNSSTCPELSDLFLGFDDQALLATCASTTTD